MKRILLVTIFAVGFSVPALAFDPNEPPHRTPEWYEYQKQQEELREQQLALYGQLREQWREDKSFRQERNRVRDQERQRALRFGKEREDF